MAYQRVMGLADLMPTWAPPLSAAMGSPMGTPMGADGGAASEHANTLADYVVESLTERLALLRRLVDGAVPIHLTSPQGVHMSALLWSLDATARRVAFRVQPDHASVSRLAESSEVSAVAYLDSVKLQFELEGLHLVRTDHGGALQAVLPQRLWRFQRRQAFRVRQFGDDSPCALLRHPMLPQMTLQLRVLDLSMGGCALLLPHDVPPLAMGLRLRQVRMDLDAATVFDTALLLHHATSIGVDASDLRLGCEFAERSPDAERALQRYIDATQKRRDWFAAA